MGASGLTRFPNWPERLAQCVAAAMEMSFAWGTHDCVLWSCNVIREITGTDLAEDFRGKYSTAEEAREIVRRIGGDGLLEAARVLAARFAIREVTPRMAQRGDVLLCRMPGLPWPEALGVCIGDRIAIPGRTGLKTRPISVAVTAWKI